MLKNANYSFFERNNKMISLNSGNLCLTLHVLWTRGTPVPRRRGRPTGKTEQLITTLITNLKLERNENE